MPMGREAASRPAGSDCSRSAVLSVKPSALGSALVTITPSSSPPESVAGTEARKLPLSSLSSRKNSYADARRANCSPGRSAGWQDGSAGRPRRCMIR
eukprot:scaffold60928_cov68-Phaeocystis_antarctica.AAC.5